MAKIDAALPKKVDAIREAIEDVDELERVACTTGRSPNRATIQALENVVAHLLQEHDYMLEKVASLRIQVAEEGGAPPATLMQEQLRLLPSIHRRMLQFDDNWTGTPMFLSS